eukprot:365959-Chlamydomonas_euryale.AAC.5
MASDAVEAVMLEHRHGSYLIYIAVVIEIVRPTRHLDLECVQLSPLDFAPSPSRRKAHLLTGAPAYLASAATRASSHARSSCRRASSPALHRASSAASAASARCSASPRWRACAATDRLALRHAPQRSGSLLPLLLLRPRRTPNARPGCGTAALPAAAAEATARRDGAGYTWRRSEATTAVGRCCAAAAEPAAPRGEAPCPTTARIAAAAVTGAGYPLLLPRRRASVPPVARASPARRKDVATGRRTTPTSRNGLKSTCQGPIKACEEKKSPGTYATR